MSRHQTFILDKTEQEVFAYGPHALAADEIRVLEIQPGYPAAKLICNLTTLQRRSIGPYKALSYVWGTSSTKFSVQINNKAFLVRENLQDALHRIRKHD
jgi:hypothetical protein